MTIKKHEDRYIHIDKGLIDLIKLLVFAISFIIYSFISLGLGISVKDTNKPIESFLLINSIMILILGMCVLAKMKVKG